MDAKSLVTECGRDVSSQTLAKDTAIRAKQRPCELSACNTNIYYILLYRITHTGASSLNNP